jgi:16S rRNA A1518/A1519 N6-dimethyltransferase RsmA/KsgA/DIM1 with predicted DNA glycosylase/AP lyase activity
MFFFLQDDFDLNYDRQEDRETVNSIMNAAFKNHKAKLHKHFKKFGSKDEALQHPYVDTSQENWIACCELFSQPTYQVIVS